ncbi:agamous-like MADS-box protein AGL82 [Arachis stenosperma]|uniref:agamous-like MADS-box protein AGL82 n=1 Tax=Arachis stenosperma TaxID=217475 RepID=UPI0025AD4380|nr:agamous-like MADS-box protein AGL82 [Arachis stenosperma]
MGRGRIPMELIEKEKARKATFLKRKNGLIKKVYEFSTLCGVDVCVIIYGPSFDGGKSSEAETWPQDPKEVQRIIQKYHNTTIDRRPRIYDVQEYYRDRVKKIEGEISKVHKEKLKIMYPTWDDSFNDLREDQLRMFLSILDSKILACNQRINMLKQDPKGKTMVQSKPNFEDVVASSNPFMPNMPQAQFLPHLPMTPIIDDTAQLPFYPLQVGQSSSQSSPLLFDQNCGTVDWGACSTHDNGDGSNHYKGNIQSIEPYSFALSQYQDMPHEFQALNALHNANMFHHQVQMFNYMHERK